MAHIFDVITPEKIDRKEFADAMNANCSAVVPGNHEVATRQLDMLEIAIVKIARLERRMTELEAENERLKAGK
jgi:hypothetical protein